MIFYLLFYLKKKLIDVFCVTINKNLSPYFSIFDLLSYLMLNVMLQASGCGTHIEHERRAFYQKNAVNFQGVK